MEKRYTFHILKKVTLQLRNQLDEYLQLVKSQLHGQQNNGDFIYIGAIGSFSEYGYLSSNKTQYSFLIYTYEYNSNCDFDAVKVYTKISKSKLKNISNDIIKDHDFNNSNYLWPRAHRSSTGQTITTICKLFVEN